MELAQLAQQHQEYCIAMRRHFHAHPEVSFEEFETSKRIQKELTEMGIEWRLCGSKTGILARIDGKKPGKTVMLRADMDALTVQEETHCSYASQNNGVMHACGHDCHIAMLLTAARILKSMQNDLAGSVVLLFQPAEELGAGAKTMVADGALEGVDGAFAMHVWSDIPAGQCCLLTGPCMASGDRFLIDIIGKSGHGATPHLTHDAVVIASSVVQNLQTIVSREISPIQSAVVTVGVLQAGTRWNVIAGTAHLEGTTRCFDRDVWNQLPEKIERIATQTAAAMGAQAKCEYRRMVPPTINDAHMADLFRQSARKVLGPDACIDYEKTLAGEDFAYYQEKVPGAMAFLGVANPELDAVWPQHHGKYQVDESALIKGALWYCQSAIDFLNE